MGPTAPERARTVLARAISAQVVWLDGDAGPSRSHCSVRLAVVTHLPDGAGRPATAEIADAAPLPVRDRILSRLRISGRACIDPEHTTGLRVVPSAVSLDEGGVVVQVDPAEFAAVEPDPVACEAGALLSHLDAVHPHVVATLTSLVDARHRHGLVRVWPLHLDRHGIVLRLEYAGRHHDARLAFAVPAPTPEDIRVQLHGLITEAARQRRSCSTRGLAKH